MARVWVCIFRRAMLRLVGIRSAMSDIIIGVTVMTLKPVTKYFHVGYKHRIIAIMYIVEKIGVRTTLNLIIANSKSRDHHLDSRRLGSLKLTSLKRASQSGSNRLSSGQKLKIDLPVASLPSVCRLNRV